MPADPNAPLNPTPMTTDQLLAELFRENERLRRQVEDARHERDQFKKLLLSELSRNATELTEEDITGALPGSSLFQPLNESVEERPRGDGARDILFRQFRRVPGELAHQ